ncbi:NAD(P)/FAD-dependent oxidoreductase [Mycobacterium sp. CVI_P3]|uniref:Pyridine nucleotide-disulfide oxidoreductase domain-containing protein 2 n=1 Tax=Mycobacterium pinniadriaticum TaxID=2994102 RepID=A0ABT3SN66_9MYCO|nr:NAD(P)/FAD-dependent oxidoreductase [Mycobacterium pinniadriaticum]MCX2934557.1 NAD(P)/FAD-dependent oxidoreductase [Mycobacterium pinniadriaticum]MCX2940980.1 NAD(P)/FAD-dependent oxidoreductase [Mycobacterium pinniadriaticum]
MQEYDIVVIGAGHNGLVAANYLRDAGFSVVVIESNERIGGMTSTSAPIASAPDHQINNFSIDSFFWDSFPPSRDLQLHRYGLRMVEFNPGHLYLHPDGGSIAFFKDPARTADDIRRFSIRDARAYLEFVPAAQAFAELAMQMGKTNPTRPDMATLADTVRRAFGLRHELGELAPLALNSISDTIAERFGHQVVRDALHASSGSTIPNDISGTGVAFVWIGNMHRYACRRAIGGIQALPDALANRLTSKGGAVHTGAAVAEVTVDQNRATGVLLVDGSHIRARQAVLATCDPRTTLDKLLPDGVLSESSRAAVNSIPVNNLGYGQMKVDLALSGRTTMKRHQAWREDDIDVRKPTHMIGTEEGMRRLFARSGAGLVPDPGDYLLWPVIPTSLDPSQAPDGQDTVYLYSSVVPSSPEGGWAAAKDKVAQGIVETASMYYDDLDSLEIGRQVLNNEDIADLTHATAGNITHVDTVLSRFGPLRPARGLGGYRTPVAGLYMGGAGSHPGGGISGGPGYVSSQTVIKDLHKAQGLGRGAQRWTSLQRRLRRA